jgi:hypothetical protein
MPALGTARLRPGPIRPGKRRRDFGLASATRRGSARGLALLCRDPPGAERGFAASLRDPGESEAGVRARLAIQSRPARDGLATQRRQSKLGQVGAGGDTGPHYDSRPPFCQPWRILRLSFPSGDQLILREGTKGQERRGAARIRRAFRAGSRLRIVVLRPEAATSFFFSLCAFPQKRVRTELEIGPLIRFAIVS